MPLPRFPWDSRVIELVHSSCVLEVGAGMGQGALLMVAIPAAGRPGLSLACRLRRLNEDRLIYTDDRGERWPRTGPESSGGPRT